MNINSVGEETQIVRLDTHAIVQHPAGASLLYTPSPSRPILHHVSYHRAGFASSPPPIIP
jgi:hypothetical protein